MTKETALLREWIRQILIESDRGGISAQQIIASRLKELRPDFEFESNQKGEQTADVTGFLDGKEVAHIESKSTIGMKGLTTVYDRTVSASGDTAFDEIAAALTAAAGGTPGDSGESKLAQFVATVGGEMGAARPIDPELETNLNDPAYSGFSHKVLSRSGKTFVFEPEPSDANKADADLKVFKMSTDGSVRAFNTVTRSEQGLVSTSSPRPWATSGKIPARGGISDDPAVKAAALKNMLEHFREDGDNYFMLVDGNDIYPFIVNKDVLDLASLGAPQLTVSSFSRAGLSTYGNAGSGKVRLALKVKFNPTFKL